MDLGLKGKVAVVTGSSRGIGRGVAEFLAAEGCDIVLHGRDKAALAEVEAAVKKAGRKTVTVVNDLSKDGSHQALVAETQKAFGKIDILVNNAGATKRGDFRQLTDQDWKDGFELKFFSHMRLAREAWPLLAKSKGSVVNIAGIGGKEPEAEFGIGFGVNAISVVMNTTAISTPRTSPNNPPSPRSSHESPVHLKNFASSFPTSVPASTIFTPGITSASATTPDPQFGQKRR